MNAMVKWAVAGVLFGGLALAADERKSAAEPKTDQEFLTCALSADLAEVKMGEIALKSANDSGVQRFAQKMIDDHGKHHKALAALARNLKLDVSETALMSDHKQDVEKLSKLDRKEFDKEYIKAQVMGHEKVLKMYEKFAKDARDASLREEATKTIPVVRGHLEDARRLATQLGVRTGDK